MATTTQNLGLIKPAGTDKIRIAQINSNMDTLDTKIGPVGNTPLQTQATNAAASISALQRSMAIICNGNTHAAIAKGRYAYVRNHSSLSEGLYQATAAISANATLSTSNLTAVSGGGLNALNDYMNEIGQIITGTNGGTVEVPNNTVTEIGSITLPAGHYIIVGCCDWAFGNTGYRQISISNTTATLNPVRNRAVTTPTIQTAGKETYQQVMIIIATSGETISLYGLHNQGSALNAYPYMYAIKVGHL